MERSRTVFASTEYAGLFKEDQQVRYDTGSINSVKTTHVRNKPENVSAGRHRYAAGTEPWGLSEDRALFTFLRRSNKSGSK